MAFEQMKAENRMLKIGAWQPDVVINVLS